MGRIGMLVLSVAFSGWLVMTLLGLISGDSLFTRPMQKDTGVTINNAVELPVNIEGTFLVAEKLVCYEGPMLEDRSDAPVVSAIALMVRNDGDLPVAEADIVMERAGEHYLFHATCLLPGMSVLVIEENAKPYFTGEITSLSGSVKAEGSDGNLLNSLKLKELDLACIEVKNISKTILENVTLYHKNYTQDGVFVGGITYETVIPSLHPGETVLVYPEHYASGYSRIFYAK